jgi:deferrochelatase/peroxidase EfeB
MTAAIADSADIQGLLRSGYGGMKEACFLLLSVANAAAARSWLATAPVTTVAHLDRHITTALHVALTASGMRALGVAEGVIAGFSAEFISGMAGEEGRSRRLGDVAASAPSEWRWGGAREPHVLLMLYAETDLSALRQQIETVGFNQGFDVLVTLQTSDMGGREPFGFTDGVSQPRLDWSGQRRPGTNADLEYGNLLSAGEFLLGYGNEYGLYTDRPLLEPNQPGAQNLPRAEDDPARCDLGRNGSYLVFRELAQDVRGFWRFIAAQSTDEASRYALAQALVGRQISGEALVRRSERPIRGVGPDAADIERNQFTYDDDKDGLRCPFGAHVRRANPRTGDMPGGRQGLIARLIRMLGFGHQDLSEDLIAASRFHRIIRRGREFGETLSPEAALQPDAPDPGSGLHFICLSANIARQFEFIQGAWLMSAKFDGLIGEADPLLGNRAELPPGQPTDGFTMPQPNGICRSIEGVPNFITVRGGAYFFLPGVRALRYFAVGPDG